MEPFKKKIYLSSPTMHGKEKEYMNLAYDTNWMSTIGENINECENYCNGASRAGANGAKAKLEYIKEAVKIGTSVTIASAKYTIKDILSGKAKATRIGVK